MPDKREEMHELLGKLRSMPEVPEPLFRLVELIVSRFDDPFAIEEAPTRPERRASSGAIAKVSFQKVGHILDEAGKGDPSKGEPGS